MKNLLFLIVMICIFTKALKGQVRYLDSIFSANEVKYNIEYGKNKIITTTKVLYMDVYSPQNDKEKNRPLVIIINDTSIGTIDSYSLVGSKSDFHLVYLAKKLTSMGYVVAVMDYRTGFFPGPWMGVNFKHMVTDSYKAVQDIKTCVRYFKKNSTLYDIDPQKIMLWGDDTGCMLALSSAFVNSTAEWFNTPKTILTIIDTTEIGNVDGTSYGIRRIYNPSTPTILVGDTLSLSNHEGFDSRVHLVVGMGQGILDTNWIDKDDCPVITFQNKLNTIKRYDDCFGYSIPVISNPLSQCGNFVTQKRANILKINKVFLGLQFKNDFSEVANSRNEGIEGIFPFIKKIDLNIAEMEPWQWWNNLYMDVRISPAPDSAKKFLDTMVAYVAPRACIVLKLGCNEINNVEPSSLQNLNPLSIIPNPSFDMVHLNIPNESMLNGEVTLYNLLGNIIIRKNTEGNKVEISLQNIMPGIYVIKWDIGNQIYSARIIKL